MSKIAGRLLSLDEPPQSVGLHSRWRYILSPVPLSSFVCVFLCMFLIRDETNMSSKMSFFVHPNSWISSEKTSEFYFSFIFRPAIETHLVCIRTNMYWFPSLWENAGFLYIIVELFHWKLLVFALILYCATNMFRDTKYRPKCHFSFVRSHQIRPQMHPNF